MAAAVTYPIAPASIVIAVAITISISVSISISATIISTVISVTTVAMVMVMIVPGFRLLDGYELECYRNDSRSQTRKL